MTDKTEFCFLPVWFVRGRTRGEFIGCRSGGGGGQGEGEKANSEGRICISFASQGFPFSVFADSHTQQMDLALLSTREGSADTWSGRLAGIGAGNSSVRSPARTQHAAFLGGCGSPARVGEPAFDLQTQLPRLTCAVPFNMLKSAIKPRTWLLGSPNVNSEAPIPQGHRTHLAGKMLSRETS